MCNNENGIRDNIAIILCAFLEFITDGTRIERDMDVLTIV